MALWDNVSDFLSGGGRSDADQGYNNASNQLRPYVDQGRMSDQQLQQMSQHLQGQQNQMDQYGNPADWSYRQINQSPNQFYNNIMSGYNQSPDAQYAQQQAMRASNAGAAASGMLGSGAYFKELQGNANNISQRDRQQYYNNVMNANQAQQQYLGNFQNQNNNLQNRMQSINQYLSQLGYGANTAMANNYVNQGNSMAKYDQGAFNDLAGLAGAGFGGGYNAWQGGGSGGGSMPQYAMNAIMAG